MNFTELCIRRPVFTTMLMVALIVLGIFSFFQLGVNLYPKADIPTITIMTKLNGASPEEIENQVTKPLEEAINTISGLDDMRSTSIEGQSVIYASFILEKDLNEATNDVRQKVSASLYKLPDDTESPIIEKMDPDAAPIMAILVSGKRTPKELTEICDKTIKRQLQTVEDVGSVTLVGDRIREIQIFVDPKKLFSYNLSVEEIKSAIQRQNVEIPAGRLTWELNEKGLRTLGRVENIQDLEEIIITDYKGAPVRIKDVAEIIDGTEEARSISRVNKETGVSLLIRKQSGSNTIKVVDRVLEKVQELEEILPDDVKLSIVRDQSRFIRKSIEEVEKHLVMGVILATLVVLLFMNNLRAALIAGIAIPISIISTFILMRVMGFTINNLTLLALSMCVGIVIDDAIIVLENIFRYIEEKDYSPFEAAIEGTKEISSAVFSTTISLVIIFLPIAFMYGIVGRFFKSFGYTAAFAIGISMFVALTIIPSLVNRFFKKEYFKKQKKKSKEGFIFKYVYIIYDKALRWALNHRLIIIIFSVLLIGTTPFLLKIVKTEFFPYDDMSEFEVVVQTEAGSSLKQTDIIIKEIEKEIHALPNIKDVFTTIGVKGLSKTNVTDASIYIALDPLNKRTISQEDLMQKARKILEKYPGIRTSVQFVGTISGGGMRQTPFNLVIQGKDIDKLDEYAKLIINKLSAYPSFVDLDTDVTDPSPEVKIKINRDLASDLGIDIRSIASTLGIMIGGEKISYFRDGSEQYDIRLRLAQQFRENKENLGILPLKNSSGQSIRLDNIAEYIEGKSPSQIDHYNMERKITVVSNLDNIALGQAMKKANAIVDEIELPSPYKAFFIGSGKMMQDTFYNFFIVIILSIIFIYIVLAAQFDSFTQPLIIMASIPLSIPFALISLYVFNQSLNVDSLIGILLLFGIVKKNAILQVDYTNHLIKEGMEVKEAIIEADHTRLRPILMTTFTLIAGMLPIAMGKGDGAVARATMATVVIGGQALCLFITLLVTPVLYSLFTDARNFFNKFRKI